MSQTDNSASCEPTSFPAAEVGRSVGAISAGTSLCRTGWFDCCRSPVLLTPLPAPFVLLFSRFPHTDLDGLSSGLNEHNPEMSILETLIVLNELGSAGTKILECFSKSSLEVVEVCRDIVSGKIDCNLSQESMVLLSMGLGVQNADRISIVGSEVKRANDTAEEALQGMIDMRAELRKLADAAKSGGGKKREPPAPTPVTPCSRVCPP